jgi:deoxyribose-phosphate aldolase
VHFEAPRTLATSANTRENQHKAAFAARFDHTLLRADADAEDITRLCQEAHAMGFGAVCVNSSFVPLAVKTLEGLGSSVKARNALSRACM